MIIDAKKHAIKASVNGTESWPCISATNNGSNNAATGNDYNDALYGLVNNSTSEAINRGVFGEVTATKNSGPNQGVQNIGLYGNAYNGDHNYGLYATASGDDPFAAKLDGKVEINGNVTVNGSGTYTGTWTPSDPMLKDNMQIVENAPDILKQLNGYTYTFDLTGFPSLNLPAEKQIGVSADEVAIAAPELVKKETFNSRLDSTGKPLYDPVTIQVVNYQGLTALLIEGFNKQQAQLDDQQNQISNMQAQLDACGCGGQMRLQNHGSNPVQQVSIVSETVALLGDCFPNPNDGKTKITVRVPQSTGSAELIFTDQLGKEVSRIAITNRGYIDLEIETSRMENGVYHYSLVVDGKLIDTKQMLKQH